MLPISIETNPDMTVKKRIGRKNIEIGNKTDFHIIIR